MKTITQLIFTSFVIVSTSTNENTKASEQIAEKEFQQYVGSKLRHYFARSLLFSTERLIVQTYLI